MRVKKGFTLLELCVGVILTGIVFSISFSYFYQMHRISSDLVKKELDDLKTLFKCARRRTTSI